MTGDFSGYYIAFSSFLAGLFALPHCAVMCGPLFAIFSRRGVLYHAGRLGGYTLMGALLGTIGMSLDRLGVLFTIQNFSLFVSGGVVVLYGIIVLSGYSNALQNRYSAWLARRLGRVREQAQTLHGLVFFGGLVSALLPCGVLFPVWTLAAGTGSPGDGALLAGGFVLGTIPGAVLITILSQKLATLMNHRRRQLLRVASATLLIATGVLLIAYRGVFAPGFGWIGAGNEADLRCHSPVLSVPVFR